MSAIDQKPTFNMPEFLFISGTIYRGRVKSNCLDKGAGGSGFYSRDANLNKQRGIRMLKKYGDWAAFYIAWAIIFFAPEIAEITLWSYRNLLGIAFIFFLFFILGLPSRIKAAKKKFSSSSDPDVAALADGRIDIAEYRKRKEENQ